ncbi:hypothetical protein [Luteipulveratus mongoliensis]|nr:hypothetical protein [Luteipulveratus mongoliensis]
MEEGANTLGIARQVFARTAHRGIDLLGEFLNGRPYAEAAESGAA